MKISAIFLLCLAHTLPALANDQWAEWTIQSRSKDESEMYEVELQYLLHEESGYRLVKMGAKADPRFELIGVDRKNLSITLLASPFESAYAMQNPDRKYKCRPIALPQDRKNFYSICNSRFALQRGDVTEVDKDKLRQALEQAGFFSVIAEQRLAEYRADYANAKTAPALKRFIEKYKSSDPDNLVPLAQKRIPDQSLEDYRAGFARAMNTPLKTGWDDPGIFRKEALRRFAEYHRHNDPEQLAAKADAEYRKMVAADEQDRLRHFAAVGEVGTTVCLDVHTDPSMTFNEKRWREAAFAQIVGTTEQATSTKIKVYVQQIQYWKLHEASRGTPVASVMVDGLPVHAGKYAWLDRAGWRLCKPK